MKAAEPVSNDHFHGIADLIEGVFLDKESLHHQFVCFRNCTVVGTGGEENERDAFLPKERLVVDFSSQLKPIHKGKVNVANKGVLSVKC